MIKKEIFILTGTILFTREGQVATITFNRPGKMNAFNHYMAEELEDCLDTIKSDSFIRTVVLRGAGEAFMAGSDVQEFYEELSSFSVEAMAVIRRFNSSILTLREMEKPVIASVHGSVTGSGISLMLAADLVIASETTQFSLGFSRIATTPAGGVSYVLPRLVGSQKAMELLLLSEDFNAHQARELGLVNWIVPQAELENKTQNIIERLQSGPTFAFAQTKQLINSAWQNKMSTQLEFEAESFAKTVNTKDFKSAVNAFINKRQPEFEGR